MYSSDESGSSGLRRTTSLSTGTRGSRLGNSRQTRPFRRHKRFNFSTETLGTLPEYSPSHGPSTRPRPLLLSERSDDTTTQVQAWANDVAVASPPPTYPGFEGDAPQEEEFVEDKDSVPASPVSASGMRVNKRIRRTRSVGRTNDRLDQLLERSVMALEASNALLQSSLSTHSSLAAVLADSSFDRSMDVQIRYLARRMGAEGAQENGLDKVLEEVVGLISSGGLEDGSHLPPLAGGGSSVENAAADGGIHGAIPSMGHDNDGLTRSLPAEDHMERLRMQELSSSSSSTRLDRNKTSTKSQKRLRLSDGPRPRSPPPRPFTQVVSVESPNRVGYERAEPSDTIILPSTSGVRTAPQEIPLFDPLPSATTESSSSNAYQASSSQPETPGTPSAYNMLSHIQSRSSSLSRAASPEAFIATFRNSPRISIKGLALEPESPVPTRGRGMGDVRPSLTTSWKASDLPPSPSGIQRIWPQRLRSQSSDSNTRYEDEEKPQTPPQPTRMPSASMVDLRSTLETPPKLPRLTIASAPDEVGALPSTSYKVSLSLRKILAEAEKQDSSPVSDVAKGKQRAAGERPDDVFASSSLGARSTRSLSVGRISSPLTLTAPSISKPAVIREDFSKHMNQHRPSASLDSLEPVMVDGSLAGPSRAGTGALTPRRSAMKGSSNRTTPLSSGQSSPRVVTFSPLPPKYESDGSVGRARAKSKTKAKEAKSAKEAEQGGWWTKWLLGGLPSADGARTFTPVHSRTSTLMREEGRWNGGMESWQI